MENRQENLTMEEYKPITKLSIDIVTNQMELTSLYSPSPMEAYHALSLYWLLLVAVTVIGNSVVLLAMLRPRARRRLANASSFILVQLAFADLAVGLFAEPLIILHSHGLMTHQLTCVPFLAMNISLIKVTMIGYALVAIERYAAVHWPYKHPRWFTSKRLKYTWMVIWIYGLLHGFLPSITSVTVNWIDETGCNFDALINSEFLVYYTFFMTYIPECIIITFVYISLVRVARDHRKKIAKTRIPEITINNKQTLEELWMAGRCLILILLHLVCHWPVALVNCAELWGSPRMPMGSEYYLIWLSFANSALDPLFYAYANKSVRKEIKRLLTCKTDSNAAYNSEHHLSTDQDPTRRKSTDTCLTQVSVQDIHQSDEDDIDGANLSSGNDVGAIVISEYNTTDSELATYTT